ncbi:MAG: MoaD/ThiS family protein [Planctomycetales bacterium]
MNVTVKYMSQLKAAVGVGQEQLPLDAPCSIQELLNQLLDRHGDSLRRALCDGAGNIQKTILVCVGDRQVPLDDPELVGDGDEVTLLTPISGG